MVSLSLPTLASLRALVQALATAGSTRAPALQRALAAFESASRASPNPAPEWHALRAALVEVEHDDGGPAASGEVAKLRIACEAELSGLSDAVADDGPAVSGAGRPVELVVNDPEGEKLLEEMEEQTEDLHLSPAADEGPADGPAPATAAEQDGPPTPLSGSADGPLPSLQALPDELLPLLLSSARPPTPTTGGGLSDSALLVTLVLRPTLVLPPGKTLLSLLARPPTPSSASASASTSGSGAVDDVDSPARKRKRQLDEVAMGALGKRGKGLDGAVRALGMTMEERVGVMMKSAWWDQTADSLLAPPPSTEPTLKLIQLQTDLSKAAETLLPPSTLAQLFPVPEATTHSAWDPSAFARRLETMLSTLKTVSAPVRDAEIGRLQELVSGPIFSAATAASAPAPTHSPDAATQGEASPEAIERTRAVIRAVQGILDLCELMRSDLGRAKVASLPLSAIPSMVRALAHAKEREDVLALWTVDDLQATWRAWVAKSPTAGAGEGWTRKLAESVGSATAITFLPAPSRSADGSAAIVPEEHNRLPPVLNACAPVLWHAQNLVQASLITALLVLLCPSAAPPDLPGQLLGLLRADLLAPPSRGHTHVDDLERALVAARPEGVDAEGRKVLRGRIDKVLRAEDPVWALLAQRLIDAFAAAIAPPSSANAVPGGPLRTGLVPRSGAGGGQKRTVRVKGFEGPALEEALGEVLETLERVREWVTEGWTGVLRD